MLRGFSPGKQAVDFFRVSLICFGFACVTLLVLRIERTWLSAEGSRVVNRQSTAVNNLFAFRIIDAFADHPSGHRMGQTAKLWVKK